MRTTLTFVDRLYEKVVSLAETSIEKSELLRECTKVFLERQTARRLAAPGGRFKILRLYLAGAIFCNYNVCSG